MEELIEKYFLGELTEGQKNDLFKQMAVHPEMQDEFARTQNSWALAVSSVTEKDHEKAFSYLQSFKKRIIRKKTLTIFTLFLKYAAMLAVGILITKVLLPKPQVVKPLPVAMQKLSVPAGQRAHLTLSDGTSVWVNAKSTLEYPGIFTGSTREVTLSGEAYFDVSNNAEQPFIVKSGHFRTQVTGTQFNVFAYDGFYNVSLIEGQVVVHNTGITNESMALNRNEKATWRDGRFIKEISFNTEDFLWKEGVYCFDDMPFIEIVEKLQLYYDVQIHVNNNSLLRHKITGKFRQRDGIENVLKIIQLGFPFVFTKSDDGSTIYIK